MMLSAAFIVMSLGASAPLAPRFAVLIEDDVEGTPATFAVEAALQAQGLNVVDTETSKRIRAAVAPDDLLKATLPPGLSVLEADAVLAGTAVYAAPVAIDEGVNSQTVVLTLRLINLATGRATRTAEASGVAVGVVAPVSRSKAARRAVQRIFAKERFAAALADVGPTGGAVTLVVRDVPDRETFSELRQRLETALGGAPAQEAYYAEGLGKIILGGARSSTAMKGPDIADLLAQHDRLGLAVVEVANTRLVARYDAARIVQVHALVLEPRFGSRGRREATQLGRYVATQIATFAFARASYQRGRIDRKRALQRARRIGADVVVESEVLSIGQDRALVMRVIDVESGRPVLRNQHLLEKDGRSGLKAAKVLLAGLAERLPQSLTKHRAAVPSERPTVDRTARSSGRPTRQDGDAAGAQSPR